MQTSDVTKVTWDVWVKATQTSDATNVCWVKVIQMAIVTHVWVKAIEMEIVTTIWMWEMTILLLRRMKNFGVLHCDRA